MSLVRVEQHQELALLKLLPQWWGKPRIASWLRAYARQWQVLEDALWDLLGRSLDTSEGVHLDRLCELIGQARHGFSDAELRVVAKARAVANRSRGLGADLGAALAALFEGRTPTVDFQAAGVVSAGGGAISVPWPAHQTGDFGVLFVATANEFFPTPTDWTFIGAAGVDTAGTNGVGLSVYVRVAQSGAEANAAVGDSGQHQIGAIVTFRGGVTVEASAIQASANVNSTAASAPSVSVLGPGRRVIAIYASAANGSTVGGYAAGFTERFENGGTGSTIALADGLRDVGPTGALPATLSFTARSVGATLAIAPPPPFSLVYVEGGVIYVTSFVDFTETDARMAAEVIPYARAAGVGVHFHYSDDVSDALVWGSGAWGLAEWASMRLM